MREATGGSEWEGREGGGEGEGERWQVAGECEKSLAACEWVSGVTRRLAFVEKQVTRTWRQHCCRAQPSKNEGQRCAEVSTRTNSS